MKVKSIKKTKYFTSADGCRITETFGVPSEAIKEASIAYAKLAAGKSTFSHCHNFLEWYIITKGRGSIMIDKKKKRVSEGDNIMIAKKKWHSISANKKTNLEFYCFCVPAFTLDDTIMKNGEKPRESLERDWND